MSPILLFAIACFLTITSSLRSSNGSPGTLRSSLDSRAVKYTVVHEFPRDTWVENLVIRTSDGSALVTLATAPEVHLIDTSSKKCPASLITTIPGLESCAGIVELGLDVFYVAAGNFSLRDFKAEPGSFSLWEIDMRGQGSASKCGGRVIKKPTKVASLANAAFMNGITVLNSAEGIVLAADSILGVVWSVNVRNGSVSVAINDTSMAPPSGGGAALGINGLHVSGDYLFYDNSAMSTLNRIPIDLSTGHATGPPVVLAKNTTLEPDDFTIDATGNIWAASQADFIAFLPDAAYTTTAATVEVVGGSPAQGPLQGPTSMMFGITAADLARGSLYVTSGNGIPQYLGRNWTAGGALSRIDTANLGY